MNSTRQYGLSLIEIMVTLAVIAILASIAAPNLQSLIEKNKVHALMDEFAASLYRTRSESAKRGYQVTLCASNAAKTACDTSATDFANGWIVFTDYDGSGEPGGSGLLFDVNGDGTKDTPEELLFVSGTDAHSRYVVQPTGSGSTNWRVSYRSNGLLRGAASKGFMVMKKDSTDSLARISIARTGRIRSCREDSTHGDAACD